MHVLNTNSTRGSLCLHAGGAPTAGITVTMQPCQTLADGTAIP